MNCVIHIMSKSCEVDGVFPFYWWRSRRSEMFSVTRQGCTAHGQWPRDWLLLIWPQSPDSSPALLLFHHPRPMSPSMFFHHKTQLGWCFLISIWTEGECSLLAAWCISMNYWTLEPSHKSSAPEETQMADYIQSSVGLSGQWLQIQHQPTPCIVGNSFHHPHLDSVSTGAGGRGSGG